MIQRFGVTSGVFDALSVRVECVCFSSVYPKVDTDVCAIVGYIESAPVETMMKFNLELTEATAYALVHFRLNHVTAVDGCSDNISVRILWDI
jgi:hypothetical protein